MYPPLKLVLFDFDGTLFDTRPAVIHSICLCFNHQACYPPPRITESQITNMVSTGARLEDIFNTLISSNEPTLFRYASPATWLNLYRAYYAAVGPAMITPYPGLETVLQTLKEKEVPAVVMTDEHWSSKDVVLEVLRRSRVDHLVDMVVANAKKPNPDVYFDHIAPHYSLPGREALDHLIPLNPDGSEKELGVDSCCKLDFMTVLCCGDLKADLQFAKNIDAVPGFMSHGYGDGRDVHKMDPFNHAENLEHLLKTFVWFDSRDKGRPQLDVDFDDVGEKEGEKEREEEKIDRGKEMEENEEQESDLVSS